jgi:transcriptional regulator with PAS, ATPase and Fis domain
MHDRIRTRIIIQDGRSDMPDWLSGEVVEFGAWGHRDLDGEAARTGTVEASLRWGGRGLTATLGNAARLRGPVRDLDGQLVLDGDAVILVGRVPIVVGTRELVRDEAGRVLRWDSWAGLVGVSRESHALFEALARAADCGAPIWLRGESGTGKERAARSIHDFSPRASGPFVTLNCAALPESLIEAELFGVTRGAFTGADRDRPGAFQNAHGGTLFLDEVGELSLPMQAKLLRALEVGEVSRVGSGRVERTDVRVVAATWRDLEEDVHCGRFRHDLLHRLWVLRVDLPPLRERPDDIPALIAARLAARNALHLFPHRELAERLAVRPWSGNVRQLFNQVERAIAYDDPALLLPEPESGRSPRSLPRRNAWQGSEAEMISFQARSTIARVMREHGGNRSRAARALGISRSTLYRWMRDGEVH